MSAFLRFTAQLPRQRAIPCAAALALATTLSGCVTWHGIGSDKSTTDANRLDAHLSIPAQGGKWPDASWADQFGDPQLSQLIAEGLADNPSIAQAKARIEKASSFVQTEHAAELPTVSGQYSWNRELYSANALFPPPYGGSWYSENKGLITASWDLDLWGKHREATSGAVSQQKVAEADEQEVRVTLSTSIAQTYNELARDYALLDVAQRETEARDEVGRITVGRVAAGLDTQVERRTSDGNIAASRASITQLEGQITATRYQLAALLGKGPDRGLSIAKPTMDPKSDITLPDNVPANLLSRRPDLVAARWTIDATQHDIKSAKAEFLPDVNLAGLAGFDAFGWSNFLKFDSRQFQAGPAIDIPIFAGGALRANLKGKYADFDLAVAEYNQTLVNALSDVATQVAAIRSTDRQLVDAQAAYDATRHAYDLAVVRYKAGLSPQLQVLNADQNLLAQEQGVVSLKMNRRSQQIALIKSLGGGFDADATGLNPPLAGALKNSDDAASAVQATSTEPQASNGTH
ncbi:efflux transporter outer membrane subunit [Pararobbsia silviterrae]|uniref:Efflux transporter outer membrane subunit n=1 Tax=Pararobbsia silviterrae TaxID=1792498 RepID=A0A494XHM0_9BURK|nr:efflux transporter outer membrane subunit [Pararobbsia silviterrae]RKP50247.1 efflux transporter outer membrane subunit [Pararobbsia silviterrae]